MRKPHQCVGHLSASPSSLHAANCNQVFADHHQAKVALGAHGKSYPIVGDRGVGIDVVDVREVHSISVYDC